MQHYVPPAIIHQVEETRPTYAIPYFYEYDGKIINLSAATKFYVDHLPFTSFYWAYAKVGSTSYKLAPAMKTKEEAMKFLRELTKKVESRCGHPR